MYTESKNKTQLVDPFGRVISYLRLSVTDKCNLRCFYCLPKGFKDFDDVEEWLTFDEIERVVRSFAELGVSRIRLTGGEPLVRKNLASLVARLNQIPQIDDLSLSTNATLLARDAAELKQAGLARINVSLDSLNAQCFKEVTCGSLESVIDGLLAAKQAGFSPIKINMVVMKEINDHEVDEMVAFCMEHDFTLRLIETMPMGDSGRDGSKHYISMDEIRQRLAKRFDLLDSVMPGGGPARYLQLRGSDFRIGFITPISQHFCETCNRVRLSACGTMYLCMGQEHKVALRPLLRAGISDQALKQLLVDSLALKPKQHDFNEQPGKVVRVMSKLGG
jgi:cyclic pyranopterin phosphate synthase